MTCSQISICFDSRKLTNLDYWSRDMPNFDILEKGLGRVSPPHPMYDFSRKNVSLVVFY